MRQIRIFILVIASIAAKTAYVYADPLIGCTLIETNSSRTAALKEMYVEAIGRFCDTFGAGELVNSALLDDQVRKFGCTDEKCLLSFMRDAKIDILITGSVIEKDDTVSFRMTARSYNNPYHGREIKSRQSVIEVSSKTSVRDLAYIAQEEAALFLSAMYSEYVTLLPLKRSEDGTLRADRDISGTFDLFRSTISGDDGVFTEKKGEVYVEHGSVKTTVTSPDSLYISKGYRKESEELSLYIYGRKKEIVSEPRTLEHSLLAIPVVPFLSASAPVSVPVGYYGNSDYKGLAVSVLSSAPWWYLSWKGLDHNIMNLKHAGSELNKHDNASYLFALYTVAFGSGGYVIDMLAHDSLSRAGNYQERVPYICNDYTAVSLSLLTPGGGMFYRGKRMWGSFYYQIDNALAYMTIKSYAQGRGKNAACWFGALVTVKTVEAIHSYMVRDEIMANEVAGRAEILPVAECDENGSLRGGLTAAIRW